MKTIFSLLALAGTSQFAAAAITSTFGACTQIAPPAIADFPFLNAPIAEAWDEVASGSGVVFADLTTNPGNNGSPTPGVLSGTYDSHFIHFTAMTPGTAVGGVIFSGQIVAVAWNDTTLDLTDGAWGAFGTLYPTGQIGRGINSAAQVSVFNNMLRFDFQNATGAIEIEQVRVWTVPVPAPGVLSLAGIGSVMILKRRRTA